jgi:hypothetical protein
MEGTVLAKSEDHAQELLKNEFGDIPEFELLQLVPDEDIAPVVLEAVATVN